AASTVQTTAAPSSTSARAERLTTGKKLPSLQAWCSTRPPRAERLRSLAGPAARNVVSRKTVMPARSRATLCSADRTLTGLVLLVPDLRLPQLHLVAVRIDDPRELAVLMRFRTFEDLDPGRPEVRQKLAQVIDPVVDHKGRVAGREPLGVRL